MVSPQHVRMPVLPPAHPLPASPPNSPRLIFDTGCYDGLKPPQSGNGGADLNHEIKAIMEKMVNQNHGLNHLNMAPQSPTEQHRDPPFGTVHSRDSQQEQAHRQDNDCSSSRNTEEECKIHEKNKPAQIKLAKSMTSGGLDDHRLFKDVDGLKLGMGGGKPYDVFDYYWETGILQQVAKSNHFAYASLLLIFFNTVWIGIETDHNTATSLGKSPAEYQVGEHIFCVAFTLEILVRFFAFKQKSSCLKDSWFKFDGSLVALMIVETWILPVVFGDEEQKGMGDASMLRFLRLLRVSRMARLMRSVPELVTLLKGMYAATRSVCSTLVLLILFTYVFAIVFKQQCSGNAVLEEEFGSILDAMWTLLIRGTLLDEIGETLDRLKEEDPFMCACFLLFVLIASFTVLNMLIGVLCEVVSGVAEAEKENHVVMYVKNKLLSVLSEEDEFGTGMLAEGRFKSFLEHPDVAKALRDLGVDSEHLLSLADEIFATGQGDRQKRRSIFAKQQTMDVVREIGFGQLLEIILHLRSSNSAMVKDIVGLRKVLRTNQADSQAWLKELAAEQATEHEQTRQLTSMVMLLCQQQANMQAGQERLEQMVSSIAANMANLQQQNARSNGYPAKAACLD